jgi:tRNA (guanine26-N2/guanine27-N2)-dimethyltransferase
MSADDVPMAIATPLSTPHKNEMPALPPNHKRIQEAAASIIFSTENEVFYNKIQCFNRDLSTCAIKQFVKLSIADAAAKDAKRAAATARRVAAGGGTVPVCTSFAAKGKCKFGSTCRYRHGDAAADASTDATPVSAASSSSSSSSTTAPAATPTPTATTTPTTTLTTADDTAMSTATTSPPSSFEGITIFEALAATGLRSVRYAQEIGGVRNIVANDLLPAAAASIRRNVEFNRLPEGLCTASHGDAVDVMHAHKKPSKQFDVVDLDPYGSAAPFLDAAVQSVAEGGLMCVTCTDMAVLCGKDSEACYAKYRSMPLKGKYCSEFGVRILLSTIEGHANRHKRYIEPLCSLVIDFYCRVFVRVRTSAQMVKRSAAKQATVYQCTGCDHYALSPVGKVVERGNSVKFTPGTGPPVDKDCEFCQRTFKIGGPIWAAPIHDASFVASMLADAHLALKAPVRGVAAAAAAVGSPVPVSPHTLVVPYATAERMVGMLTAVVAELPDVPLFYNLASLCSTLHAQMPKAALLRSAVLNAGYRCSQSHHDALALKTDAPMQVVWDILRCYLRDLAAKDASAGGKSASGANGAFSNKQRKRLAKLAAKKALKEAKTAAAEAVMASGGDARAVAEAGAAAVVAHAAAVATTAAAAPTTATATATIATSDDASAAAAAAAAAVADPKLALLSGESPAHRIRAVKPTHIADFTPHPQAQTLSKLKSVATFMPNPEANWGPKARAGKRNFRGVGGGEDTDVASNERGKGNGKGHPNQGKNAAKKRKREAALAPGGIHPREAAAKVAKAAAAERAAAKAAAVDGTAATSEAATTK